MDSPDSYQNSREIGNSFKSIITRMRSSAADGETNYVINIMEVNEDRLASMHQKISEPPRLLTMAAGRSSCCIFRVPESLIDVNGKAYQPRIVSIGPYHRGKPQLRMIEEHKWRYLGFLLRRMKEKGLGLEDFFKAIQPLEMKARECYSETIQLSSDEFLEMIVLDGCFIIELFRKVGNLVPFEPDDPIVSMLWILPFFYRDFLRVENQIPFFLLQCLFDLTKMPGEKSGRSLSKLALEFFNNAVQRPDEVIAKYHDLKCHHLLDLVRASFIPSDEDHEQREVSAPTLMIHSVSKLRRAGIKLNPRKADSFLVIKFRRGVIEMPPITIDDFMSSLLLNCVAFEQCHRSRIKHFTDYATLLDCLVNTYKDVEYLCQSNVFENYFGTEGEVARFINDMGKETAFDINNCYLSKLFSDVHQYYRNSWHVQWASFKHTYFQTPWSFISALAALILLLLTIAQTFFTIYSVYKPDKS
ncbi:Protein of unknown function DUF247 [Theobroma cacao]|uniref:Uncharacterized protein n=2 Tax=Theobroma cacao TaxID=3641 RepID=A0A061ESX0_THECC|nr:PREDICTED: UPF0481 protein At3g47200 [Theobroma cacao]EOY08135.1 Uncharacterized protein TCM_022472 [Theobroma cacao]WRX24388.1 Protein of unknown function DUF247 [Theobroma cacao]